MKFRDWLKQKGACSDFINWVGNMTLKDAWEKCNRGDWMIWVAAQTVERKKAYKAACACDRHILTYFPGRDLGILQDIETVEAWLEGRATDTECKDAIRNRGYYRVDIPTLNKIAFIKSSSPQLADIIRKHIKAEDIKFKGGEHGDIR